MRQKNRIYSARGNQLKRKIDHAVGTPLLFALGLSHRRRHLPSKIATVGILSCSAIGDTIIASAIARDLKVAFPACKVVVFVDPSVRNIISLVEGFDQEVSLPITRPLQALRIMRAHPTDVLIDITPWPRMTALATALARTRFTIGFRTDRQHRHFAYDAAVRHSDSRHEVENFRALLAPLGVAGQLRPRAHPELRDPTQPWQTGARTVVLHPWASGFRSTMREWPMACWATVARDLIADGAVAVITGGRSDGDRAHALSLMIDRPGQVTVLAGRASLLETARELATADVVISVNTGIMHLAAALDRNMVALHGPTDPIRWGPLSDKAVVIGPGRGEGGAYLNLGFEYPPDAPDCMALITVDEVLAHARPHIGADQVEVAPGHVEHAMRMVAANAGEGRSEQQVSTLTRLTNECVTDHIVSAAAEQNLSPGGPDRRGALVKRAEDLVFGVLLLILALPAIILISLAIKLESPGPVLFRQARFGYNGRIIEVLKFRSMHAYATDQDGKRQTTRRDPRVTSVGVFLRKHSLDELPQLLNVITGQMSLVGPRPHVILTRVDGLLLENIVETYNLRYRAKPGITGLAQVNGWRGPLDTVEKVVKRIDYDLKYIRDWSPWLDFKIMLKTVRRIWRDRAAY